MHTKKQSSEWGKRGEKLTFATTPNLPQAPPFLSPAKIDYDPNHFGSIYIYL